MRLQVIQDSKGKPTGVYIPIKEWNALKKQHKSLDTLEDEEPTKQQLLNELKEAVVELKLIQQGNFNVSSIPLFDKQAKRLAKKYPSLKKELTDLINTLSIEPTHGSQLGNSFYKIRLSITSKGKGKSGGARVITFLKIRANTVYLTSIFDKSERASISNKELEQIFKLIP
jgi:hypothetical protein